MVSYVFKIYKYRLHIILGNLFQCLTAPIGEKIISIQAIAVSHVVACVCCPLC